MSKKQAFLWVSGWSIPADIWEPYYQEWPSANHYSLSFDDCEQVEQMTQKAIHTIQKIEAQQVIVVGWSLGAMIVLQLALRFPRKISHLCLISGVAEFIRRKREGIGWDERVLRRMKKQLQIDPWEVIRSFDQRMFSTTDLEAGHWERWDEKFRKHLPSIASLQAGLDFLQQFSLDVTRNQIEIPVSLLSGAEDSICLLEATHTLAQRLPRSTLTVWQKSGHACFWTQKERFHEWMKEVLCDEYQ